MRASSKSQPIIEFNTLTPYQMVEKDLPPLSKADEEKIEKIYAKFQYSKDYNCKMSDIKETASEYKNFCKNYKLIYRFYLLGGYESGINSHLEGIDFSKPFSFVLIKKGMQFQQVQGKRDVDFKPGSAPPSIGNYLGEIGSDPLSLGTLDETHKGAKPCYILEAKEDVLALLSTASPIEDMWSIPPIKVEKPTSTSSYFLSFFFSTEPKEAKKIGLPTKGGGSQLFCPNTTNKFKFTGISFDPDKQKIDISEEGLIVEDRIEKEKSSLRSRKKIP